MNFHVTVGTDQGAFYSLLSGFVYACHTYMEIFFGWVSMMEVKCAKIFEIPANNTLAAMLNDKCLFDLTTFQARCNSHLPPILFVVISLVVHCTRLATITATDSIFVRTVPIELVYGFCFLTPLTLS